VRILISVTVVVRQNESGRICRARRIEEMYMPDSVSLVEQSRAIRVLADHALGSSLRAVLPVGEVSRPSLAEIVRTVNIRREVADSNR